jgi:hypothetical protein
MPINRLLEDSKLTLEGQAVLNLAFDRTLRKLHLVDRNDPICEIVARKVIEIGATGVTNPVAISEIAVRQLGPPQGHLSWRPLRYCRRLKSKLLSSTLKKMQIG